MWDTALPTAVITGSNVTVETGASNHAMPWGAVDMEGEEEVRAVTASKEQTNWVSVTKLIT